MPSVANIGEFTRDERFEDWWHSPRIEIPFFSGRTMPISVINLPESKFEDGEFPSGVTDAIHSFLKLGKADRTAANPRIYKNYKRNQEYCRFLPWMLLGPSQVWRYNHPTFIRVEQSHRDSLFYVVLSFNCDWEEEHGMRLVYRKGSELTRVAANDGHLHDFERPKTPGDEQTAAPNT